MSKAGRHYIIIYEKHRKSATEKGSNPPNGNLYFETQKVNVVVFFTLIWGFWEGLACSHVCQSVQGPLTCPPTHRHTHRVDVPAIPRMGYGVRARGFVSYWKAFLFQIKSKKKRDNKGQYNAKSLKSLPKGFQPSNVTGRRENATIGCVVCMGKVLQKLKLKKTL